MDRIPASTVGAITLPNGKPGFEDANLAAGIDGTDVPSIFMNDVQESMVAGIIEAAGETPVAGDEAQLMRCIGKLMAGRMITDPQTFASSGVYTRTAAANWARVLLVGPAGGGGGVPGIGADTPGYGVAAGGGGAGGWIMWFGPAALLDGALVTIGSGGPGGVAGTHAGSSGGQTSLVKSGVLQLIANGGSGGATATALAQTIGCPGGGGGNAGAPVMTIGMLPYPPGQGEPGNPGFWFAITGGSLISGKGGSSILGGGANSVANAAGQKPATAGAGGSGASVATSDNTAAPGFAGGDGADGYALIEEFV